jgi:hypothetical protein
MVFIFFLIKENISNDNYKDLIPVTEDFIKIFKYFNDR